MLGVVNNKFWGRDEFDFENCSGVHVGAWVVSDGVPSSYKGLVLFNMKWKTRGDQYIDALNCMIAHPREGC